MKTALDLQIFSFDTFKQILPEHGEIHFKTDNRGLFEYSLVSFSHMWMKLNGVWLDLHASDLKIMC